MHKKLFISITFFAVMLFSGLSSAAELVNINKANAAAIQQNLVGIGPIKAEAIVSYRKKNGNFKSIDDLQNVTGLGPALIKKNKSYVSMTKGLVAGDDKAYAASKKQAGKSKATSTKKAAKKTSTSTAKTSTKSTAKTSTKSTAKKSTSTKSKTDSTTKAKTTSKTKTTAKASKSTKKSCSGSTKTMSKAEKKACAAKKAKAKAKAKKTTTKPSS